jgi:long-chain acyl-CoA synthetase
MITVAAGLQCGLTINFPESTDTVQENIREIGPRV